MALNDSDAECQAEANARLIAAAPDLLEACKAMVDDFVAQHGHHEPNTAECCDGCPYCQARAAIAKAS